MSQETIQQWTTAEVLLKFGMHREVRYRVYREGLHHYLQVQNTDETPIHTLQLPEALRLEKASYEVLLRYVLLDIAAA